MVDHRVSEVFGVHVEMNPREVAKNQEGSTLSLIPSLMARPFRRGNCGT